MSREPNAPAAATGVFDLKTPSDLLQMMARELERLRGDPSNADHAFNLFVTAEHMLDWLYPGREGSDARRVLRDSEPLLQIVSHIANGAKHFDRLSEHHRSVVGYQKPGGFFPPGFFADGYFADGYFPEATLTVALSEEAARDFGNTIAAVSLAERVYHFWDKRLSEPLE